MELTDLPQPIVALIMDYKREMEEHEQWLRFLEIVFANLLWPGFVT